MRITDRLGVMAALLGIASTSACSQEDPSPMANEAVSEVIMIPEDEGAMAGGEVASEGVSNASVTSSSGSSGGEGRSR